MTAVERGVTYRAGDLPPDSIVSAIGGSLYRRCSNIDSVARWGQPIPGSENWMVVYLGEAIEVDETPKPSFFVHRYWRAEGPRRVDPKPVHGGAFAVIEQAEDYLDRNESPDDAYGYIIRDANGRRVNRDL